MDHHAVVLFTIDDLPVLRGRQCERRPERPRPVVYKINLRFRRFGCGTGQITGLSRYYIARDPTMLIVAKPTPGHDLT